MRPAVPLMPAHRVRRYLGLVLVAGVLLGPSLGAAALAIGGFAAAVAAGAVAVRSGRRARAGRATVPEGVVLGADPAGRPVGLTDRQLGAHALIVGASGAGKSTTLLAILSDQIARGRPVVAIDMKGSPAFAEELRRAAAAAGRELRVWTPDGPTHWNPLAHGNATALKDKLIATERFSEPHYKRAAERYVQTALQVIHASHPDRPAQLQEVVELTEPRRLRARLRDVPDPLAARVQDYLGGLTPDQVSAVRGLGTRLALLSESSAGPFLSEPQDPRAPVVDVRAGLEGGDVILFSLNSSVYGGLAAQLGTLAIQDLVSAAGERLSLGRSPVPATVAIDEFSAVGADNVLALLARGRECGVPVLLATQELSDLERAGPGFRDQVLGITGVKLAHRQDVPSSAHTIAQMAGTRWEWEQTERLPGLLGPARGSRGTRRLVERYVVHPNVIKTLGTGDAVLFSRVPTSSVAHVRVAPGRPRAPGPGGPRDGRAPGSGGPGRRETGERGI